MRRHDVLPAVIVAALMAGGCAAASDGERDQRRTAIESDSIGSEAGAYPLLAFVLIGERDAVDAAARWARERGWSVEIKPVDGSPAAFVGPGRSTSPVEHKEFLRAVTERKFGALRLGLMTGRP